MPNGKFFQATEMESGAILGMADEWKGRKCGWSRVSKGKNGCYETTKTRSFRSFGLIRTLGFMLIGVTGFWRALSRGETYRSVGLCSVLLVIWFRIDGREAREAKESPGKELVY